MPLTSYERKVVPNGAGTSTRVLGQYVREEKITHAIRCHRAFEPAAGEAHGDLRGGVR